MKHAYSIGRSSSAIQRVKLLYAVISAVLLCSVGAIQAMAQQDFFIRVGGQRGTG